VVWKSLAITTKAVSSTKANVSSSSVDLSLQGFATSTRSVL